jgi:uncharacterized protein (TIGR03437 family)
LHISIDQSPASGIDVYALGPPALSSVVNGASFSTHIAPGGFATILGSGFAPGVRASASSPFPSTLGGVSVMLNGTAAPLSFVSDTQVNFLTPDNLLPGMVDLTLANPAGSSTPLKAQVDAHAPGIFFDIATGFGAVLIAGTADLTQVHPAKPGDYLEVYCTGLGALNGQTVQAALAGGNAPVVYSGQTPIPGLYQVDIQVPSGIAPGKQPLTLSVAGVVSNSVSVQIGN